MPPLPIMFPTPTTSPALTVVFTFIIHLLWREITPLVRSFLLYTRSGISFLLYLKQACSVCQRRSLRIYHLGARKRSQGSNLQVIDFESVKICPVFTLSKSKNPVKSNT